MTKLSGIRPPLRAARRKPTARLLLEALEDRCVPAVGAVDTTFNFNALVPANSGKVTTALLGPTDSQVANGVAVQADGKIVAAGTFNFNAGAASNFAVVRYNNDGSLDTTFGNGGHVTINTPGTNEQATSVTIQNDNKIVVAGFATIGGDDDFVVARLNPNGSLDTTFNTSGVRTINFAGGAGNNDQAFAVTTQIVAGARKIVVAGSAEVTGNTLDFGIARLNDDGSNDTGFNGTGLKTRTFGATDVARAVTIDNSNRIVAAGFTGTGAANNFAILRLTTTGADDGTFGPGGERTVDFGGDDRATGVAVQTDNKIVVGGFTDQGAADFAVTRLNDDGTLDTTTFNPTGAGALGSAPGKFTFNFGSLGVVEKSTGLVLQKDGKIVMGGFTALNGTATNPNNFAVARVTTAGALDTTFDGDGLQTIDFGGNDQANAIALDLQGRIVLAGQSALNAATNQFALTRVKAADQLITPGAFDPATGKWYLRDALNGGPPTVTVFAFGAPGWLPVTGDWDGNGTMTIGVFDPATATFYLRNSNTPGPADFTFVFGPTTANLGGNIPLPVAGDWDGDGKWSVGVFAPSRGDWNLRNELSTGLPDAGSFLFGSPGSKPVVGDWNGDGVFSQGVVEPDGTWKLKNFHSTGTPDFTFVYGSPTSLPVAGDWNGDNIWGPGAVDATGGVLNWKLRNTPSAGAPDFPAFNFGADTYLPVTGDWDFPVQPQFAAGGQGPGAPSISTGDLNGIVQAALGRLGQEGVSPAMLARLSQVTALLQPLSPGQLGGAVVQANTILLSPNGAGHGWFVDPTPYQDEEFSGGTAYAGSPAAGREDLLTTVMHELGHLAGLPDNDGSGLMGETLAAGVRRIDLVSAVLTGTTPVVGTPQYVIGPHS